MAVSSTIGSNLPPSTKLPKAGRVSPAGLILPGIFAIGDASNRIKNGEGVVPSIGKAVGTALVQDTIAGLMGPVATGVAFAGSLAVMGGSMAIENGRQNTEKVASVLGGPNMKGKNVINSSNAVTMRQRGMAMINQAGETQRSALGNEARAYFRNSMY